MVRRYVQKTFTIGQAEQLTPLLVNSTEAARLLGISRTVFYELVATGRLGPLPIRLTSKKLYSIEELQSWVQHRCEPRDKWQETRLDSTLEGPKITRAT